MELPSTPQEALEFLAGLAPSGVRLGLDRIHGALASLGMPDRSYPVIHVAGTNGKGSTCAFVASCLRAESYRVGLYTSPHLVRVNERIQVDGQEISDEVLGLRLLEVLNRYDDAVRTPFPLTYFELGTLVALWHFAREEVDVAVVETGLGGRLDATTATRPIVTAITPVSYDHMDYLGHTLAAIAQEKAGILKPQVPAVIGVQPPEAIEVIERVAREVGAPLEVQDRDFSVSQEAGADTCVYRGIKVSLPGLKLGLRGEHQVQNAAVALCCLELASRAGLPISAASMRTGLANARWPGRLEEVSESPTIVLDGAHNPAGAEALARAMSELYPGRRVHLVFGVLGDKDHRPMIRALFPRCASVHLGRIDSARALAPEKYLEESRILCQTTRTYATIADALAGARAMAAATDVVLCSGSLFLVGEVKRQLA